MQVNKLTPLESHPGVSHLINEFKSNDAVHWCSNRHRGVSKVGNLMMYALEQPVLAV